MSRDERSRLLQQQKEQPRYVERSLQQLPYQRDTEAPSILPAHLASPSSRQIDPHNPAINKNNTTRPPPPPPPPRDDLLQSQASVASYGGQSILGGEAGPRDIMELLDNLEKATKLIRRHLQEEEGEEERIPVALPLIPRWVTSYLLLITFIWQSNVVMTAFQGVHLMLVFFVSSKLVKKVIHRTASGSLLAQSYLSTVLLFAGLYTLEFRFRPKGFEYVYGNPNEKIPTMLFLRMLYFSVSTATLCGTSEVEPLEWYANLTVSVQMLMSFVYFASILSLGVIPQKKSKNTTPASKSLSQRIRDYITKKH